MKLHIDTDKDNVVEFIKALEFLAKFQEQNEPVASFVPEVDKRGFPWDSRIHSRTKARLQDGSWRYKRNVDPKLVKQVESELKRTPVLSYEALINRLLTAKIPSEDVNVACEIVGVDLFTDLKTAGAQKLQAFAEVLNLS